MYGFDQEIYNRLFYIIYRCLVFAVEVLQRGLYFWVKSFRKIVVNEIKHMHQKFEAFTSFKQKFLENLL